MKLLITTLVLMLAASAFAHDEGHGPKLSDTGKYGGLVSAVVLKSDAPKGAKAALMYKAELSRGESVLRVYLYDRDLKPLDLKAFATQASADFAFKIKNKWKETTVTLELKGNSFQGQIPKIEGRPYNIDITFKENGKELLSAFDNLD